MDDGGATVFIVDDDTEILKALSRLLRSAGWRTATFSSPEDFLQRCDPIAAGCLVLDIAMPGVNGLDLQAKLFDAGCRLPIIFLTGNGDVPTSVRAMRAGALNFLTKPVSDQDLLDAVREAFEKNRVARLEWAALAGERERLARLTEREREVLAHVCAGRLNKQIADDLGVVEKTIKVHRGHVMEKMGVRSLAELVRMAERLGVVPGDQAR